SNVVLVGILELDKAHHLTRFLASKGLLVSGTKRRVNVNEIHAGFGRLSKNAHRVAVPDSVHFSSTKRVLVLRDRCRCGCPRRRGLDECSRVVLQLRTDYLELLRHFICCSDALLDRLGRGHQATDHRCFLGLVPLLGRFARHQLLKALLSEGRCPERVLDVSKLVLQHHRVVLRDLSCWFLSRNRLCLLGDGQCRR